MKTITINHNFLSEEWLEEVGLAIGVDSKTTKGVVLSYQLLGKTQEQIEQRLNILAQLQDTELVFSHSE